MPVYVVTHREEKELVVVVEADSREAAEAAVAEAASYDFFDANGVPWEYEDSTDADDAEDDEKPEFRVNANEELEHVPSEGG